MRFDRELLLFFVNMAAHRYILPPILLFLQLLLVAGGPVVAQYCCGQRVSLQTACEPLSCCPDADPCCEEEPCSGDDVDLTLEFAYVGALDDAIASSHTPECAEPDAVIDVVRLFEALQASQVRAVLIAEGINHSPPERAQLGVRRL
jgi:hypothetical protein